MSPSRPQVFPARGSHKQRFAGSCRCVPSSCVHIGSTMLLIAALHAAQGCIPFARAANLKPDLISWSDVIRVTTFVSDLVSLSYRLSGYACLQYQLTREGGAFRMELRAPWSRTGLLLETYDSIATFKLILETEIPSFPSQYNQFHAS